MNQKTLYIIGGSVLGITLVYFGVQIYKANRDKQLAEKGVRLNLASQDGGTISSVQQGSLDPKKSNDGFPIKVGSYGNRVMVLQSALNNLGASLTIDGRFGQSTYNAIVDNSKEWGFLCKIGFGCSLSKDEYDSILKQAETNGWDEAQAKVNADKNWLPFVNGDDYVYANLKM